MGIKDFLVLSVFVLGFGGLILANRANYYELRTRQLEAEVIRLRANYEGFKESALILND